VGALPLNQLVAAAATASKGAVRRTLDVQLNWSEYFQGEWTVRESSGFNFVRRLFEPFDASKVSIGVSKEVDPELGTDGAVWITLYGFKSDTLYYPPQNRGFRVVSKNSLPQIKTSGAFQPSMPYSASLNPHYNTYKKKGSGPLSITFVKQIVTTDGVAEAEAPKQQTILSKIDDGFTLLPCCNQMKFPNEEFAPLISPVFYADDVYTFFVEPSLTETKVDKWEGFTIPQPSQKSRWQDYVSLEQPQISVEIPPKYRQEAFNKPQNIPQPDPIDSLALHAFKPNLDALTQPGIAMQFGDIIVDRKGIVQELGNITQIVSSVGGGFNLNR